MYYMANKLSVEPEVSSLRQVVDQVSDLNTLTDEQRSIFNTAVREFVHQKIAAELPVSGGKWLIAFPYGLKTEVTAITGYWLFYFVRSNGMPVAFKVPYDLNREDRTKKSRKSEVKQLLTLGDEGDASPLLEKLLLGARDITLNPYAEGETIEMRQNKLRTVADGIEQAQLTGKVEEKRVIEKQAGVQEVCSVSSPSLFIAAVEYTVQQTNQLKKVRNPEDVLKQTLAALGSAYHDKNAYVTGL